MLLKVETPLGAEIESEDFLILFGNKNASLEKIKLQYPQFQFCRMKQVHGHEIISAQNFDQLQKSIPEADAQITNKSNHALNVVTADCTPVMIFARDQKDQKWAAGIHAGWRGVQQRIVPLTIEKLIEQGCTPENMHFLVGPHIEQKSFEVQKDVLDLLLQSFKSEDKTSVYKHKKIQDGDRYLVNLAKILEHQLSEYQIIAEQISSYSHDTMTDLNFHSYRRDKETSGRQISFIALK